MHLTFKETKEEVYAAQRVSKHVSPHLHNALEIVCVTEGTLEMGVGKELYHMEKCRRLPLHGRRKRFRHEYPYENNSRLTAVPFTTKKKNNS